MNSFDELYPLKQMQKIFEINKAITIS